MGDVSTIVTGIETRAQAVLGNTFVPMPYVEDVARNNWKGTSKSFFGVLAGDINQAQGVTTHLTVSQTFQLKLVGRWTSTPAGDSPKRALIQDLQEKCLLIYKDLIVTKAGSPSLVINILEGMSTETNLVEPDGILEMRMIFEIQYRKYLNN